MEQGSKSIHNTSGNSDKEDWHTASSYLSSPPRARRLKPLDNAPSLPIGHLPPLANTPTLPTHRTIPKVSKRTIIQYRKSRISHPSSKHSRINSVHKYSVNRLISGETIPRGNIDESMILSSHYLTADEALPHSSYYSYQPQVLQNHSPVTTGTYFNQTSTSSEIPIKVGNFSHLVLNQSFLSAQAARKAIQAALPSTSGSFDTDSHPHQRRSPPISQFGMDRQTSTSPLVQANGLDDSQTSLELNSSTNKPAQPPSLVRKASQVHPISEDASSDGSSTPDKPEKTSNCLLAVKLIVSLLIGIYFGWFLQKSSVYKPEVIRNQFLFREFIMLKTFLAALLSSQFCILILSWIPPTKSYVELAKQAYSTTFCYKGVISTVTGAAILGAGMAVGGACPGMVLAQNGSLVPNSIYTTLGGFLACIVYGFLHKYMIKLTTPSQPYSTQYIYEKLKVPFVALAVPCMVMCLAAITLMEVFIPETERSISLENNMTTNTTADAVSTPQAALSIASCNDNDSWFTQEMWSPSVCGVLIGLIQIPIILLLTDTMGSSSGYQTIVSQWVVTDSLKKKFPYFASARSGLHNYWMVVYILGAAVGGALGALSSCTFFQAQGVVWWQAVLGGFLMLFGSRLASGCTSGHGISGAALLVGLSWLAVPAMFGGGIITAFIMEYSNTNYYAATWWS